MPQKLAGIRMEPPPSVPMPSGAKPAAIAAPVPPLEAAGGQLEIPRIEGWAE